MTNEQRALWKQTKSESHVSEMLKELQSMARVSGRPEKLEPGYDALVLAAMARSFSQGQHNILDALEAFGEQVKEKKELPKQQFQATPEFIENR